MSIPKPAQFLTSIPLYAPVSYEGEQIWDILNILYYNGTYDSFCTKCKRESTFKVIAPNRTHEHTRNLQVERLIKQQGGTPDLPSLRSPIFEVEATCTRHEGHKQNFVFFSDLEAIPNESGLPKIKRSIQKIGQQPSYGDLHILQVKKYSHVLSKAQLGELTRAIGLASHDVGVGAYVYLRRIFENLVEEAHIVAQRDSGWDEGAYSRCRMSEKITMLKAHLPAFLVEHPGMYSLLSKGIHELSEEDCLKHFPTLRIGIELILDERLEAREKANKIAAAKAAIQKAVGEYGA
ncbi:hypothetical protein ABIC99_003200 [Sphaerotilus sulfidivorans]|uniref:Short-chain dehydrogenase n=1 Tax=Sphaerotilus sulfidivorans TaxID=639200 RepID=A0A5C1PZ89_9BURK|nr:short-chain dehydrogenase [Sphaerotilus sulfidivorans]NZD48106.1 short-chain dehydrogenase [Sphaerotilus sulfidivorans]QEN00571.1 short-chain dehydrogenase [Sphaerotilus sulfidivorans]